MMSLILAQLSSGGISVENLGIFVLAAAFLSKWAWDYKRASREDSAANEPRANPPLHRQYVSREEFSAFAERIDEFTHELRTEIKADNTGVHNRITEVIGLVRELKGRMEAK